MNRIILIGNGFDKAHGMATSYQEFIDDYWTKFAKKICHPDIYDKYKGMYEDGFVKFNIEERVRAQWIQVSQSFLKESISYKDIKDLFFWPHDIENNPIIFENVIEFSFSNQFFGRISEATLENWVDVENEYNLALLDILKEWKRSEDSTMKASCKETEELNRLNEEFKAVQNELEVYLTTIFQSHVAYNDSIQEKIFASLKHKDIAHSQKKVLFEYAQWRMEQLNKRIQTDNFQYYPLKKMSKKKIEDWVLINKRKEEKGFSIGTGIDMDEAPAYTFMPNDIMIINFNYTDIVNKYIPESLPIKINLVHIHGQLNTPENPIVFGYGDELDEHYQEIENRNKNQYLQYIKSTSYLKTDNYRQILEFAASNYFQIYIMGHSCGNSDRTLLNTLFEHKNCVSIKPFYHQRNDGSDNYSDIVRNISRNFKDKQLMRERVVNQTYCEPLC